jgi:hypothetical protein
MPKIYVPPSGERTPDTAVPGAPIVGGAATKPATDYDEAAKQAAVAAKKQARQAWISKNFGSGIGQRAKMNSDPEWEKRFETEYAKVQGQRKSLTEPKPKATPEPTPAP